jgi:acetyltransferase
MAEVLGKQPRPDGPRLAMVTNAGGPAALATDLLIASGGQLATLAAAKPPTNWMPILPAAWSHGKSDRYALGGQCGPLSSDGPSWRWMIPAATAVLAILTPQAMTDPAGTAERLAALAAKATKPLLASWMGGCVARGGARKTQRCWHSDL